MSGLVILLLIANIATISFFWMGMRNKHDPAQQPSEYIIKELALNVVQQKEYKAMVDDHRKQSKQLNEQIRALKDSFFELLTHENINDSNKNMMATRIAALDQQLDLLTFDHFKQVRKICTLDQQQKFDKIIKDILRMMGRPAPRGNHPPPPGGNRPPGPPEDGPPPPGN